MRASQLRRVPSVRIRPALWFCACNLLAAALTAQCTNPTPVLTNQTVSSGVATYSDNNALTTNAIINGSASITLSAGLCIELTTGFHATAGTASTTFHAMIGAASNAPFVTSLTPASGAIGASVTISGANFGTSPGGVTFNGAAATVSAANWHAGSITVQVPQAATTGNVVVTASNGTSNGVTFTVIPSITSLSTNLSFVSSPLTINGSAFGTAQGTVSFGAVAAAVTSWTSTAIVVTVPSLPVGNTGIVVTAAGVSSTPAAFTVLDSAPSTALADPRDQSGLHPNPKLKFTFIDPNGGRDIQWVQMAIGDTMDHSCVVFVWVTPDVTHSAINLMSDAYNAGNPDWGVQKYFGVADSYGPLHNSQCQIDYATSTAQVIGNNLEISLDVTFSSSYAGVHTMYSMAQDVTGLYSGAYEYAGAWSVTPAYPPTVTTTTLTPGVVGTAYSQTLAANGGSGPYTWSVASGSLPPGLTLSASGVISGTPTTPGAYMFTVRVTGSDGASSTLQLGLDIPGLGGYRTGVRPTGGYWGAAGEQIDLLSGNLNYTLPVLKPRSRGGWSAAFLLSYNSQMWLQSGGVTTKLSRDVGYGLGWTLQAGAIAPFPLSGAAQFYTFRDATGAEYRMWQQSDNVPFEQSRNVPL
ncbi:MAG: IPT/TIG domain-containing protein, partial [Candidatus Solibacter sp.]